MLLCSNALFVVLVILSGSALEVPAMRLNIWIVVAILFALFAVTRYPRYHETPRICLDDPTASVCKR
jgi:hypothetical protein